MHSKAALLRARQELFGDEATLTPMQKRLRKKLEGRQQQLLGEAVTSAVLRHHAPDDAPEVVPHVAPRDTLESQTDSVLRRLATASFYSQRNALQGAPLAPAQTRCLAGLTKIHEAYDAAMAAGLSFQDFVQAQIAQDRVPELIAWLECHTRAHHQPLVHAALGGLHILLGDGASAAKALAAAIAHGSSVCRAYGDAGNLVFRAGESGRAIPLLRAAVRAGPREIDLHERLAMCLFGTGAMHEVEAALSEARKHGALTERGWTILGQLALQANDAERAVATLGRALALQPTHVAARLGIASAYGMLEDLPKVRAHIDVLLEQPPTKGHDIETLARIQGAVVGRCVDAQDPRRLRQLRHLALAHDGRNSVTLRLLADAFVRAHMDAEAAAMCQRLIALPMADPETSLELADLCARCDLGALAIEALQTGHKTFKRDTGLARKLAQALLVHQERPHLEQILPLLRMAMRDGSQVAVDRAMVVAAVDKLLGGKHAAETLWRMCSFDDGHKEAYVAVARAYMRLGVFSQRAEKALRHALSLAPADPTARLLLGRLLKSVGRLHEAAPYLDPPAPPAPAPQTCSLLQKVCRPLGSPPSASSHGTSASVPRYCASVLGKSVEGVWRGHSCDGSMVLETDDGALCWSASLTAVGHEHAQASRPQDSVAAHLQSRVTPAVAQMFAAELARPVQGRHTSEAYIDALAGCGGESFLVGGLVRRVIHACAHDQSLPDQGQDVDMVTSLAPAPMFWMTRDVAHDVLGTRGRPGGVTSPASAAWHGVVSYGRLDIASLRTSGMFADKIPVLGRAAPVFPLAFFPDIAADCRGRDFRCNAVYYDPQAKCLLDPTGGGIEDAIHRRLHLVSTLYIDRNPTLALRFCKLRCEGYSTDATTSAYIRDNAKRFSAVPEVPRRIARLLVKQAPAQPDLRRYVDDTLAAWGAVLREDCQINNAHRALARHSAAIVQAITELRGHTVSELKGHTM